MEVIINGVVAELGDSMPAITKKSIDITNPTARFIDFTNRFDLPDTQINRQIFDSPHGIGTNNRSFDKLYTVVIRDVFEFFRGKGFLDSATKDKFSFQVVDSSKDLLNSLDKPLYSILWDDKDTLLTTAQINALDALDIDSCWFWGKACYHNQAIQINTDQTTGDDRCKYSRPSFYVQGLLNRALALQGYTFNSPLPDLAFTSNHEKFYFVSYQKTLNQTYNPSGTLAMTDFSSYDYKYSAVAVTTTTVKCFRKFSIRVRGNVTTNATINLLIHAVDQTGKKTVDLSVPLPTSGVIDFTSSEIYDGPTGMTVSFTLSGTGQVVFDDCLIYLNLDEKEQDLSTNPWLGFKIKAQDILPDLTYLDLLRLICVVSNKFPIVDTRNKTLSFGSFSQLNKMNAVDWSDKFIIGSENINSTFGGLFQENKLKYTNDKTVPIELGESYFNTDNENLEKEGDYIVLNFGASIDAVINSNKVAQISIYSNTTRIQNQTINIRLFFASGSLLQFSPLSWENLAATYYANYFNSLYRIRAIDCEFNLNKLDVLSWTENKLVYVDYFKTTFIVLEISNFMPGVKTKVKLLNYGR